MRSKLLKNILALMLMFFVVFVAMTYVSTIAVAETVREPSDLRYLHTDHLGSTAAVSDEYGQKVWEGRYLPYGSSMGALGMRGYNYVNNNPLRYTDPSGNQPVFDPGQGGGDLFPKLPEELEFGYIGKANQQKQREIALEYIRDVALVGFSHPNLMSEAIRRIRTTLDTVGVIVTSDKAKLFAATTYLPTAYDLIGNDLGVDKQPTTKYMPLMIPYYWAGFIPIGSIPMINIPASYREDETDFLNALVHESVHALNQSSPQSIIKTALFYIFGLGGDSSLAEVYGVEAEIEAYEFERSVLKQTSEELLLGDNLYFLDQFKQARRGIVTPWDELIFWMTKGVGERLEEDYHIRQ